MLAPPLIESDVDVVDICVGDVYLPVISMISKIFVQVKKITRRRTGIARGRRAPIPYSQPAGSERPSVNYWLILLAIDDTLKLRSFGACLALGGVESLSLP